MGSTNNEDFVEFSLSREELAEMVTTILQEDGVITGNSILQITDWKVDDELHVLAYIKKEYIN